MWNPFKKKPKDDEPEDNWEENWDQRLSLLEGLYGKSHNKVGHSVVPFELGGGADVVYFDLNGGRLSVTAELIGQSGQKPNSLGNYELAIAHKDHSEEWGPQIISKLSAYTLEAVLNPFETMDVWQAVPDGSSIDAFMFFDFGQFSMNGSDCGVLLCFGITAREKRECLDGNKEAVIKAVKSSSIFPFTDMKRGDLI